MDSISSRAHNWPAREDRILQMAWALVCAQQSDGGAASEIRLVHKDDGLVGINGVLDLAPAILGQKVARGEEHEDRARVVDVQLEMANVVQVVDVEKHVDLWQ